MARLKLDENVPDSVGVILRQADHDVAVARDEELAGVDDDRLLAAANVEDRVLVSLDRDFASILRHPPEATAGVVVIRLHAQTLSTVRQVATRIATCFPGNRYVAAGNRILVVAYTEREGTIRFIHARVAAPRERRAYEAGPKAKD